MRKVILWMRSFSFKVTLALILSMLLISALSNLLISRFSLNAQFDQLRDKLKIIAQTATLMIDADTLLQVPLNRQGINTVQYNRIAEQLRKIKAINRPIKYIYTLAKTDREGIWQFIVDPEPFTTVERKGLAAYPGDKYDASRFPEMLKAFTDPAADKKLEVDEWGVTLSGYAPIRDKQGKAIAVLGVDITADDVYKTELAVRRRSLVVLMLGIILSLVLGLLISKNITDPIRRLVSGTRHLAKGDLHYQVEVKGKDEIGELAASFNNMARSLNESRMRLHGYFYQVVQSLVRILEARDHYTRGHSDRVAAYAEKVALKMRLPPEKIEILKETAELHDIGKLGIKESILNKNEKLTEEEWEVIRRHPIIGEDILRPVLLTEEMLAIVRGHHERYDGTGYPDKLSGKNINLFAQILAVADAYDAMTSPRAYRQALSREKAIQELEKNSGSQFNPEIVAIFLQILAEEPGGGYLPEVRQKIS
jgi:HD-GYP domain-containing protein (c-di-GMP phosphodiesterase class II)